MDKRKIYWINKYKILKTTRLLSVWAAMLFIFSCSGTSDEAGKALVNIRLIDAPGDFDEAWIEVLGVEILQGRSRESNDSYWEFIPYQQPNQQVDLSKLVAEGVLLIGRTEVPLGLISQIRLILGEDHFLTKDGNRRSLSLATPGEAEIEVEVNYSLEGGTSYDLYLDFDLERSIRSTADSTQFLLSPVVRSFLKHETSELGGRVRPSEARPILFAIQGPDTLTTLTDQNGAYTFRGLGEGKHTIVIHSRKPYMDSLFFAETEIGKLTVIEDILLRVLE